MKIKPITELRNTQEISDLVHKSNEPIFITKNGYGDMVIMSIENYEKHSPKIEAQKSINLQDTLSTIEESNSFGFLNVCCAPIKVRVADIDFNAEQIISKVLELSKNNNIILFSELCLTSYSCGDLFLSKTLKNRTITGIKKILEETKNCDSLFVFGAPLEKNNKLFNCALVCLKGKILGIVPKKHLPNYREFYESRHFYEGDESINYINIFDYEVPFSTNLLFQNILNPKEIIGIEICEDLWALNSPHVNHVNAGASIILNLSASNEVISKETYRRNLVKYTSAKTISAYLYCSATSDESTTDLIFSGSSMIYENGNELAYSIPFENKTIEATLDLDYIYNDRISMTSFPKTTCENYKIIKYKNDVKSEKNHRKYSKYPFLPKENKLETYEQILNMQAHALAKRIKHTNTKKMVLGLSGGLDSTLAFLVCVKCADILNMAKENIIAIALPCFGTSSRTKNNAIALANIYNTSFLEISIKESVIQHLKDINHSLDNKDVTYENAQARERTQVLMDYANKVGGIVIGTGDLSEIALGWSTYNGDHMSMYAVNASLPKTLIRDMITTLANVSKAKDILLDIVDTPVSPELLPTNAKGEISQLTEDLVGPYILHDFFLYYFQRYHFSVKKIYFIAKNTFYDQFDDNTIKKWLKVFIKRFFSQQFKRSCMPDGVKIGSVSLSPRGDLRMPSDASYDSFLKEIDEI